MCAVHKILLMLYLEVGDIDWMVIIEITRISWLIVKHRFAKVVARKYQSFQSSHVTAAGSFTNMQIGVYITHAHKLLKPEIKPAIHVSLSWLILCALCVMAGLY